MTKKFYHRQLKQEVKRISLFDRLLLKVYKLIHKEEFKNKKSLNEFETGLEHL